MGPLHAVGESVFCERWKQNIQVIGYTVGPPTPWIVGRRTPTSSPSLILTGALVVAVRWCSVQEVCRRFGCSNSTAAQMRDALNITYTTPGTAALKGARVGLSTRRTCRRCGEKVALVCRIPGGRLCRPCADAAMTLAWNRLPFEMEFFLESGSG